jgi:hypothetical protein
MKKSKRQPESGKKEDETRKNILTYKNDSKIVQVMYE